MTSDTGSRRMTVHASEVGPLHVFRKCDRISSELAHDPHCCAQPGGEAGSNACNQLQGPRIFSRDALCLHKRWRNLETLCNPSRDGFEHFGYTTDVGTTRDWKDKPFLPKSWLNLKPNTIE